MTRYVTRLGRQDLAVQTVQVQGRCGHVHDAVYSHEDGQASEPVYVFVCGQSAIYQGVGK